MGEMMQDSWAKLNAEVVACRACPRLVAWREQVAQEKRRAYQTWEYWGKPVPSFGDVSARLMLVGLAPGAHGSNRTGRAFTGDSSGVTLYAALHRAGFANQPHAHHRGDGLVLTDAFITAIGRCAPPQNKPTATEIATCRPFFEREFALMPQLQVMLALGGLAFNQSVKLLQANGYDLPRLKFQHGLHHPLTRPSDVGPHHLLACYHPSRQNTQTGRLTPAMLDEVFTLAKSLLV